MPRLTNATYSDRELLLIIADAMGDDGLVSSVEIAERLQITSSNGRSPAGIVSARLSWMSAHKPSCPRGCNRHFGYLQRVDPKEARVAREDPHTLWRITQFGQQCMSGKLPKAVVTSLERMGPGSQLLAMRTLTQRAYVEADPNMANATRRMYLHQAAQRKR